MTVFYIWLALVFAFLVGMWFGALIGMNRDDS